MTTQAGDTLTFEVGPREVRLLVGDGPALTLSFSEIDYLIARLTRYRLQQETPSGD